MNYKIIKIKKSNSKFRTIYAVDYESKIFLRKIIPYLEKKLKENDKTKSNYAFIKGRNCVLNAMEHIGYKFTLSMDLENFFDSIRPAHVKPILGSDIINKCFIDDAPRQGLPTSPAISNIAFLKCDEQIIDHFEKYKLIVKYTRYADDLTFSFDDEKDAGKIKFIVTQVIESNGFKLNKFKTKLQKISNGRIIITGIAVDKHGLHPTRKTMRKIRAAAHQKNNDSLIGLREWASCKLPK